MSDPTNRPIIAWLDDIAESERQLAAGETVPAEPVLQQLRESIARLAAKRASEQPPASTLRRWSGLPERRSSNLARVAAQR